MKKITEYNTGIVYYFQDCVDVYNLKTETDKMWMADFVIQGNTVIKCRASIQDIFESHITKNENIIDVTKNNDWNLVTSFVQALIYQNIFPKVHMSFGDIWLVAECTDNGRKMIHVKANRQSGKTTWLETIHQTMAIPDGYQKSVFGIHNSRFLMEKRNTYIGHEYPQIIFCDEMAPTFVPKKSIVILIQSV